MLEESKETATGGLYNRVLSSSAEETIYNSVRCGNYDQLF